MRRDMGMVIERTGLLLAQVSSIGLFDIRPSAEPGVDWRNVAATMYWWGRYY